MGEKKVFSSQALVIGLALFSMFFGSGNLIFPLAVGRFASEQWLWGAMGFVFTAVMVPFLGVIAMVVYEGDYRKFFSFLGTKVGFLITFSLLIFWIPFGSAPRCIVLSHSSLTPLLGDMPLWGFALLYSSVVFLAAIKKSRIIDVLGVVLTPLLLACISLLVWKGIHDWNSFIFTDHNVSQSLSLGLLEGYNTMDLIASFFFSSTIIGILREKREKNKKLSEKKSGKSELRLALHSGLIGTSILGGVYFGLLFIAAANTVELTGVAKEELLPTLANLLLGEGLGGLAAALVSLACLSTSIALASVFTDFLRTEIFKCRVGHKVSLLVTCALTFGMSTLGFEGLADISEPVFQVLYPILLVLILSRVPYKLYQDLKLKKFQDEARPLSQQRENKIYS